MKTGGAGGIYHPSGFGLPHLLLGTLRFRRPRQAGVCLRHGETPVSPIPFPWCKSAHTDSHKEKTSPTKEI